jgi:chromosome partitioning protein
MKTVAIISEKGGAGKTTIAIYLAVAAESKGMSTALFDLDPQASASSWSDKRNKPSPAVVSARAARLAGLLEQAAAQSADLAIIDSAPNAVGCSQKRYHFGRPVITTPPRAFSLAQAPFTL